MPDVLILAVTEAQSGETGTGSIGAADEGAISSNTPYFGASSMTTTSISELVERQQCSCMEVHGEDPDCIFHGEETEWALANILPSDWQQRVMDLRTERDALESLTRSIPTDEGAVERVARALCDGDPDELVPAGNPLGEYAEYPRWMLFMPNARAALTASIPDAAPEQGACYKCGHVGPVDKWGGHRLPKGDGFCNYAAALTTTAPEGGAELGRFDHHPDPATDYECEVAALIGMAYERLTMGGHPDLEERIGKAREFRSLNTPGELRWLSQRFNGTREIYAVEPDCIKRLAVSPTTAQGEVVQSDALLQHVEQMQVMCAEYVEPATYRARFTGGTCQWDTEFTELNGTHSEVARRKAKDRRDQAFINDMIYMLDGPEQRQAFHDHRLAFSHPSGEVERLREALKYIAGMTFPKLSHADHYMEAVRGIASKALSTPENHHDR